MRDIRSKLTSNKQNTIELYLQLDERVHQFTRILHGGVSVVLAESAASIGAALNTDLTQFIPVGVEINANHLRSISKGTLRAVATPAIQSAAGLRPSR